MTPYPLPWKPPPSGDVEPLPVGKWWDAVRAERTIGERALTLLGDDTGAVIKHTGGTTLYWLIATDTARSWHLRQVRVLTKLVDESIYLGVPPADWHEGPRPHWRVPLGPGRYLTDTQRLWDALAAAVRAELGPASDGRRLCFRCQLPTDEPVIVGEEHGGSLGGGTIYACPQHAEYFPKHRQIRLVPTRPTRGDY